MKKLEQTIQRNCINWYKRTYPNNYIRKNEQIVKSGDPDIMICHYGVFVAIEMKQEGKSPTSLQRLKLDMISRGGGVTGVAHSLQEFKDIVHKAEGYSDTELSCESIGGTTDD